MLVFVSVLSFDPGWLLWPLCLQGSCVNLNTLDRVSPLHGACVQGHAGCAKLLVENGANVSEKKSPDQTLTGLVTVSAGLKKRKTLLFQR